MIDSIILVSSIYLFGIIVISWSIDLIFVGFSNFYTDSSSC